MKNVPILMQTFANRMGTKMDTVPHGSTVEMMIRELGVMSDLQVMEILMHTSNLTLGFDATIQEGVHINSVHSTDKPIAK